MSKKQNKYTGTIIVFLIGFLLTMIGFYTIYIALWIGTFFSLPFGVLMIIIAMIHYGKTQTVSANTCQDCGVKDSTVQLYMSNGDCTVKDVSLPTVARYLCANCRSKYELEDKGLRVCERCDETVPVGGSCSNCGAP